MGASIFICILTSMTTLKLFKIVQNILYYNYLYSSSPDGPYDDKIQVSPLQFVTNWTQSFTMTCLATDVYPLPSYVSDDITCDNGNKGSTCTFTPHSPTSVTKVSRFQGFIELLAPGG